MNKIQLMINLILMLGALSAQAKIRNGYAGEIQSARSSLMSLMASLKTKGIPYAQRTKMKHDLIRIRELISYHDLTNTLLADFKRISPSLYEEIDALTDADGTSVDVYVSAVPESRLPSGVAATTNLNYEKGATTKCRSEFGLSTVSIKISTKGNCLVLLAHEFGHAKYQVLHLDTYPDFYDKAYGANPPATMIGHHAQDSSGHAAVEFEKRYHRDLLRHVRSAKNSSDSGSLTGQ